MKTIESAFIFPFTLMIMVMIIFLSFDLHDRILYKASAYKFLVRNNANSYNYSTSDERDISLLENYINKYSLSDNSCSIEMEDNSISISSQEYNSIVDYAYFNKCDLLRKCMVANDIINDVTANMQGE